MSIDAGDVHRVARLARIRLDEDEARGLADDLTRILEHVDALRAPGLEDASDLAPHLRDDLPSTRPEPADAPEGLVVPAGALAPDFRDGFFVVPPLPGLESEASAGEAMRGEPEAAPPRDGVGRKQVAEERECPSRTPRSRVQPRSADEA